MFNGDFKAKPAFYSIVNNITPLPTSAVTPKPTPTPTASKVTVGDLNGDKAFNSIDFGLLRQYILGIIKTFPVGDTGSLAADVNADGVIDVFDLNSVKAAICGVYELDQNPL